MESAGTFVASGVGSSAIFNLVKRAFAKLDEFGKKSDDVKAANKKLDQAMVPVQSVLTAVDQGQIKVPGKALDDWIWQFRTAVEEAEDAIDEIDYYKLEEKVQARDNTAASGGGTVPMKKTLIRFVKHLPGTTDSTLKRLKEALKGLEKVSASVEPFLELVNSLNISSRGKSQDHSRFRETGSLLTEQVVIGREKEANVIIQWLENPGENIAQNISAFSVIGMGGMGKTTLARLICQEIQEKKILPFNTVAWVTVSDNFGSLDAKVILTKILEDITKSSCGIQNLSTLQGMLKEQVLTKKFLLVLDDVWRDDPSSCDQWAQILAPLKFGRKGSKIVFTTRTESVADMITKLLEVSKESDRMRLTGLDDASTLELLDRYAFADVPDPDEHPNLRRISEDIARKLGGCPLAAKVMGLLLNDHVDFEYWERIWKQDISNLPSGEKGIMAVLRLSYHHLPAELQLCFRYCSIFPHQHKFIKDDLIGKLISLQKLEDFNIWEEDGYKISELKELKDVQELNIKHLNKVKSSSEAEEAKMNEKQSLKSLFLYWFEESSNSELILDTLKPHPHLQKLHISGYYGSRSPNWLENGYLSNLVSLRLYTCHNWEFLPPLGILISLRSLWLTNFPKVKQIGPSFYGSCNGNSFPSLRELRICDMSQCSKWIDLKGIIPFPRLETLELESCPKLRTLPTMPFSLKLLSVRFSGLYTLPNICSTETGSPSDKPAFSILKISDCPDIVTLESGPLLQQDPFQSLEEITIESCQELETLPPKGFSGLISLNKLMIRGCPNLVTTEIRSDILPTSLSELWIEKCGFEESLMCSLRDLTSLVRIELRDCSNIRSLPSEEVFVKLTSLQHLSILDCAQISSLGGLGALLELSFFRITRCDELIAISSSQPTTEISSYQGKVAGTALKIGELYISHSSLLQIEPLRSLCFTKKIMISWESQLEFWPDQWMLQNSAVLEEIEVDNAGALKFVPPSIVRLKSLMKLTLSRASLIDSLPELPISLRVLVITSCNEVFNKKYKKDSGSNWQEIEDIPQVVIF
ncbi:Disease resistance protein RGA2 [Rhynchospora pubera]|uniref:Disease resistance protein RGA2 n=1 Tax=Rhynchospora pubera TaxID=906938 RepID=A0AAV8FQJ5_9POAL|nr:Disease resistance protein RGA2 [Rhynchospora pubera]